MIKTFYNTFYCFISFTLHRFISQNTLFPSLFPSHLHHVLPELLSLLCGWLELVATRAAWYRQLLGVSDGRYKKKSLVWFLPFFPAGESLERQKFRHIGRKSQGSPDRRTHGAAPAKFYVHETILTRQKLTWTTSSTSQLFPLLPVLYHLSRHPCQKVQFKTYLI